MSGHCVPIIHGHPQRKSPPESVLNGVKAERPGVQSWANVAFAVARIQALRQPTPKE